MASPETDLHMNGGSKFNMPTLTNGDAYGKNHLVVHLAPHWKLNSNLSKTKLVRKITKFLEENMGEILG